jgi:hypothetical protein
VIGGPFLILALSAALLVALVVLGIGMRQFLGIVRERRPPSRTMQHSVFGILTSEGTLWTGTARAGSREVHFYVGGTDLTPDERMLRRVSQILATFTEFDRRAVDFLHSHEPEVNDATLEFYMLGVNEDDAFTMDFIAENAGDRVWRVEFESGVPFRSGFDD